MRVWTQGIVLARQVLYQVNHAPDLEWLFFSIIKKGEAYSKLLRYCYLKSRPQNIYNWKVKNLEKEISSFFSTSFIPDLINYQSLCL
jgi:hypothetical protein